MTHDFNTAILEEVAHRPWRMPDGPWVMTQTWHDLLFAHWRMDPLQLQTKIPTEFALDLFGGDAWLAVVPFRMTNVSARGVPALPWISEFPELNVRTYVRVGNRPGVFFFSLDAGSSLAVHAARTLLNLPYYGASMKVTTAQGVVEYHCRRDENEDAEFLATYEPMGPASLATEGSLEHFLTERYCLYNLDHRGRPYRLEIHHPPWALQPARAHVSRNTMAAASGLNLPDRAPLLHFAKRQDVVAWTPTRV
jgi:uncharacterized protein